MIPNILNEISKSVSERLQVRKSRLSLADLRMRLRFARTPQAFESAFLRDQVHAIAEVKFRSPALGMLEAGSEELAVEIAGKYLDNGATALSVLTEQDHFQGKYEYLIAIRKAYPNALLLMKDFILEEYQILEARMIGADAVLLILALLGAEKTKELLAIAHALGLGALVEVHDEEELEIAHQLGAQLIGVNNRNLKTLAVSLTTSFELSTQLKPSSIYISESGISGSQEMKLLRQAGYRGFLVGSTLMSSDEPGERLRQLLAGAK